MQQSKAAAASCQGADGKALVFALGEQAAKVYGAGRVTDSKSAAEVSKAATDPVPVGDRVAAGGPKGPGDGHEAGHQAFAGHGQSNGAVANNATVPSEAGQKLEKGSSGVEQISTLVQLEKKKEAGDDRRLKDIPATTVLERMYTALGTRAQVDNAT
ncbi:uncharacterized protein LOC142176612 [Nicotiana tabacum]|uniref:Uncharacterized protein LOC142176612 n=1 Tax=Nicotiana tabacum TaxID=4097 RepID=A0AC58TU55_TOBAC